MFWNSKKTDENASFLNSIKEIRDRLDLIEDDIKRLRKKARLINTNSTSKDDEDIIKTLEDDGFKEIRQLHKEFGNK
jgi:HEAT repeat protein